MNILSREIERLRDLISSTKEPVQLAHLHQQLRKTVKEANKLGPGFYCSMCGEGFKYIDSRNVHSFTTHKSITTTYGD